MRTSAPVKRSILAVAAPLILIAAALLSMLYLQSRSIEQARQRAYGTLEDSAQEQSATLTAKLDGQFRILETYADTLPSLEGEGLEEAAAHLSSVCNQSGFFSMLLTAPDGETVSNEGVRINIADRAYFRLAMSGQRAVEKLDAGKIHPVSHFILSAPVKENGRVVGVVSGSFSEELFTQTLISQAFSGGGYSFVCDGAGLVLAGDEHGEYVFSGSNIFDLLSAAQIDFCSAEQSLEADLRAGATGLLAYTLDGSSRYAVYIPLGMSDWMIVNVAPASVVDEEVRQASLTGYASLGIIAIAAAAMIASLLLDNRRRTRSLEREKEELRAGEEKYSVALKNSDVSIWEYDPRTSLLFNTNREARGAEPHTPAETAARGELYPEDAPAYLDIFKKLDAGEPAAECVFRADLRGDGSWSYVKARFSNLFDASGDPYRAIGTYEDVTDKFRMEHLELAAETDSMTGFLNHNATLIHIGEYLEQEGRDDIHALYMMDIDNFKQVNDTFGHPVGDECIRQVSASLKKLFRTSDIMGRYGGDEFLVLMKNVSSAERVRRKAREVVDSLQFAYTSAGTSMQVSVSLGVSVVSPGGGRVADLVAAADAALYEAKKGGKNRYSIVQGDHMPEDYERPEADIAASRAGLIQLQALLEYMDSGVVLLELGEECRLIYVSPGFCRMMGVTQEGYSLPRALRDARVHPEDLADYEKALREGAENGAVVDLVIRDGVDGEHWHWRHVRAVRIPYEASERPVLIAVISDIDRLKEQEAELDFSEERYRTALAKTGATIWEMDLRTGELFRKVGGEMMDKGVKLFQGGAEALAESGLIHPDSLPEFLRMMSDITSGKDGETYSLLTKGQDGKYVWGSGRFALLREKSGKPYYAIGVLEHYHDIGEELRRFERELMLSDRTADSLKAMCRVNLSENQVEYFSWNNGQYSSGQPEDYGQLRALLPEFLAADEDRAGELAHIIEPESLIDDYRKGLEYRILEFRRLSSDGSSRWTSCSIVLTKHPISGDIYAFGYMRDIDQRRRWELSCGEELRRDEGSLLYTRESALELIESLRRSAPDGNALCALSVTELYRLENLRAEKGAGAVATAVRTAGRMMRMLLDGDAVVGRLDESRAVVFRPSVASREAQERNVQDMSDRLSELCRLDHDCRLFAGVLVAPIGELDVAAALEKAGKACEEAVRRAEMSVKLCADSPPSQLPSAHII